MYDPKLEQIENTLAEQDFPKIFAVELNADCNLACSMCHHGKMRRPKGVLPFELFRRCADQIARHAPQTDLWFSFCGEPLLSPERFFECVEYGRSVGLKSLNLNTNGVHLTPEVSDRIVEAGLRMAVVGIDALSTPVYERIRVLGDRDVVYANTEYLLKRCAVSPGAPEVMVQFIEMESNVHELDGFKEYWLSRGATIKARNQLSWGGQIASPVAASSMRRIPCPWAVTMMHVFWDGRVPRCPGDTEGEESVGNAWDAPLDELWRRLGAYRGLHLSKDFESLPARCHECTDWMTGASVRIRRTDQRVAAYQS